MSHNHWKGSCPEWMENSMDQESNPVCGTDQELLLMALGTGNATQILSKVLIHLNDTRCPLWATLQQRRKAEVTELLKYSWSSMSISWRWWDLPPTWLFLRWDKLYKQLGSYTGPPGEKLGILELNVSLFSWITHY